MSITIDREVVTTDVERCTASRFEAVIQRHRFDTGKVTFDVSNTLRGLDFESLQHEDATGSRSAATVMAWIADKLATFPTDRTTIRNRPRPDGPWVFFYACPMNMPSTDICCRDRSIGCVSSEFAIGRRRVAHRMTRRDCRCDRRQPAILDWRRNCLHGLLDSDLRRVG